MKKVIFIILKLIEILILLCISLLIGLTVMFFFGNININAIIAIICGIIIILGYKQVIELFFDWININKKISNWLYNKFSLPKTVYKSSRKYRKLLKHAKKHSK